VRQCARCWKCKRSRSSSAAHLCSTRTQLAVVRNLCVRKYVSILDSVCGELNTTWGEVIYVGVRLATSLFLPVVRTIYSDMEFSNKWWKDFSDDVAAIVFSFFVEQWSRNVHGFVVLLNFRPCCGTKLMDLCRLNTIANLFVRFNL